LFALFTLFHLAAWVTFQGVVYTKAAALGKAVWNTCVQASRQGRALPEVPDLLREGSVWRSRHEKKGNFDQSRVFVRVRGAWTPLIKL
jgi:hypothetical protein